MKKNYKNLGTWLLMLSLSLGSLYPNTVKADCDQTLNDAIAAIEAQKALIDKLEQHLELKNTEIQQLKSHDTIIYRQPVPWLILGGVLTIINPAIGIPVMAIGAGRAL